MINQAYDQKNRIDYDMYTATIKTALNTIKQDKDLKASIAQISKMTGIHRNTISSREWVRNALKKIKEDRITEDQLHDKQMRVRKESLEEKLTHAQNEVIYWFGMYQETKNFFENTNQQLKNIKTSRDYYESLYKTSQKSLLAAEQEIERLKNLLEQRGIHLDHLKI